MSPGRVESILQQTADPQVCPTTLPPGTTRSVGTRTTASADLPGRTATTPGTEPARVDALNAVTHEATNAPSP